MRNFEGVTLVNKSLLAAPVLALSLGALAFGQTGVPPTKVGIIHIQNALAQTKDGQKAGAELDAKYRPRRDEVQKKQAELQDLEQQYRSGANTMADDARAKLMRNIEQHRKQLQRDMDDAQSELQQDQDRILRQLFQKMLPIIDNYANKNGFALVLDVSSPNSNVLFASNTIDITRDIVGLYDQANPGTAAAAAAPAAKPAAPAAKPAAPAKK
jgi:outer membrane protein